MVPGPPSRAFALRRAFAAVRAGHESFILWSRGDVHSFANHSAISTPMPSSVTLSVTLDSAL
jgi:hypothetical protein